MNERELERRFRSVTEDTQPNAPQSLRNFLHALPETEPVRQENPIVRLWREVSTPPQVPRLALGAGALALAVVLAIVGSTLLMNARNHQPAAPSSTTGSPSANPTFTAGGFVWTGNLDPHAIVPLVAVAGGPDGYLGVGVSPQTSRGVLLTSADALHWTEAAAPGIDPAAVDLQWVARGHDGYVAVGRSITMDPAAAPEPRFFYSSDGRTWQAAELTPDLMGGPALRVVAGDAGYLATGWNGDNDLYVWSSADGKTWHGGLDLRTVKGEAFTMWAGEKWVLSGTPVAKPHEDNSMSLPIFHADSTLVNWASSGYEDATGLGPNAANLGPVISGIRTNGGMKELLVVPVLSGCAGDATACTKLITTDDGSKYMPAMSTNAPADLRSIVLTGSSTILGIDGDGVVYTSMDWAMTWQRIAFDDPSRETPTGNSIFDLGNGRYLLLGDAGLWVAKPS